jgi:hypothetical protein
MRRTLRLATVPGAALLIALAAHAATLPAGIPVVRPPENAWSSVERSPRAPHLVPHAVDLPPTVRPAVGPPGSSDEVGYERQAPPELNLARDWASLPSGGRATRWEIRSNGAQGLRIVLRTEGLPRGLEIRVYSPDGSQEYGPYRPGDRPRDVGLWWSPAIFGETLGLEAYDPSGSGPPPTIRFESVDYLFETETLGCELDVTCYPGLASTAAAVAKLTFTDPRDMLLHDCTGTLVNRPANDKPWLLLTANHCISTESAAASLMCLWKFEHVQCDSPQVRATIQTNGATLLNNSPFYDSTLLGLTESPPDSVNYLDYDLGPIPAGVEMIVIHHPQGTYKRFADLMFFDTGTVTFQDDFGGTFDVSVWKTHVEGGAVEKGSSGSALLDESLRIHGPLTGSPDLVCAPDEDAYFGRFDLAYPIFQTFLGNIPDPVYLDASFGGTELGTSPSPFRTLLKALSYCATVGSTLSFAPGTYTDNVTITRPMTLTAPSGGVTIGQ